MTVSAPNQTRTAATGFKKLFLRSYEGEICREISTKPPRDCTENEVPVVDLSDMFSEDLEARKAVAQSILHAAETSGFFYIKNHGISEDVTLGAHLKAREFFALPLEQKQKVVSHTSSYGYHGFRTRQVNVGEGKDRKEVFNCHYEPEFDPTYKNRLVDVPQHVRDHIPKDKGIWEPVGVDGFQESVLTYWAACLATARRLIRLIALALDLPEDYFDQFTTYPGGDFALTFYPGHGEAPIENPDEVGVGAHTDLQILTLLWQDQNKGLQVLNSQNEWIIAPPIPGTLVVNIGDFLMRLTNDRLKSTVHRVVQHNKDDRYSMPFFFGFNFDEKLGVLPTCASEENPPKYQPATCGELIAKRLALGDMTKAK